MAIHSLQAELKRLRQAVDAHGKALEAQRRTFENLETALVGFQDALMSEASEHPNGKGIELLSIAQLCQELGMGKSWAYSKLKSGEIPSIKLGRSIKVKREDLEKYLDGHRYQPAAEE
jgi:excisionase family DNA binding protein